MAPRTKKRHQHRPHRHLRIRRSSNRLPRFPPPPPGLSQEDMDQVVMIHNMMISSSGPPRPHPPRHPPPPKARPTGRSQPRPPRHHPPPKARPTTLSRFAASSSSSGVVKAKARPFKGRNPENTPSKARPASQPSQLKDAPDTSHFTRSPRLPDSWHDCVSGAWHPPVAIWTNETIGLQIGPKPDESVQTTREAEVLFECPCDQAIIKCQVCHLNCCSSCRYNKWQMCKLCVHKKFYPRGGQTLCPFLWNIRGREFSRVMNDHT